MKVLSLTQPWATLVMLGEKEWETRSRRKGLKGETAIHASKGYPKAERELARTEPFLSVLRKHGLLPETLPVGVVLGRVFAHETVRTEDVRGLLSTQELAFGGYGDNRFCTRLSGPICFPKPIPAKGSRSLWPLTEGPMPPADDVKWYAAKCRKCGFASSSEYFGVERCGDDSDVWCPLCVSNDVEELRCPPLVPGETSVINISECPPGGLTFPDFIYIGRPKKGSVHDLAPFTVEPKDHGYFGNPFKVGSDRDACLVKFEAYSRKRIAEDQIYREAVRGLHGKVLVCHCKPLACHGDVLKKLAAEMQEVS